MKVSSFPLFIVGVSFARICGHVRDILQLAGRLFQKPALSTQAVNLRISHNSAVAG
jgi:hypothetical protein